MQKKTIAVLFGGCSSEYAVSLSSAYSVIKHIDENAYRVLSIGISRSGDWFLFDGDIEKIVTDTWRNESDCTPVAFSQNRSSHELILLQPDGVERIRIDAAFPVLHGKNGEDGTVQGLFELAGIPLVGCKTLSSALCMDKYRSHKLVEAAGIAVPNSIVLDDRGRIDIALTASRKIGYPLFVKPVRAGSSFGISCVQDGSALSEAIRLAFRFDDQVILEQSITGFEVGCAVMGNDELMVGELDEVELSGGFFNYEEKYTLKTSALHVPARISSELSTQIKEAAKTIYRVLGCSGFARVDMFLTPEGKVVFNEVNTIPGFTVHSRFPNMMKAAGVSFEQVLARAIGLAVGV